LISKADEAFKSGNYTKAVKYYSESINKTNNINYVFYMRAYSYFNIKKYEESKNDIKKALKISKKSPDYNWLKSSSYWLYSSIITKESGINKKSLKYLKKA